MESVSDDAHALKSKISTYHNDIKSNPYNYDGHVELVSLLSKLYQLYKTEELKHDDNSEEKKTASEQKFISFKKLRHTRQNMSSLYPLSVDLWMKWIDDEVNADPSLISHEVLEEIFTKATEDYLSVDIWCSYVNYLIEQLSSGNSSPDIIRDTLEKAVTNCGLHYYDGHKIWICYQEFELKYLFETEKKVQKSKDEASVNQFKHQLLKVVKLYKRVINLALAKHEDLLIRFRNSVKPFIATLKSLSPENESFINMEEIEEIHLKVSENMKPITINEDYLEEYQHSFDAYQSYLSHELDSGLNDPARIQCLFERAIVYHCLKPTLWLDYIDFVNNVIRFPDLTISVCKRALRNITWDSRVDIRYAVILEKHSHNSDEIRTVYEEGLQKFSNSGYNYCNLFIAYLAFEKRICENEVSVIKKKPKIYQMIQRAVHQFKRIEDADKSIGEFVLFWIEIERFWFNNEEKVKDIWKYMLANYKNLWYQAITYARTVGSADLVSDMFSIMLLQFPDEIEMFCQSFLNYENAFGTIDSVNFALKKTNLCLPSRLHVRKTKECQSLLSKQEHKNKFIKSWLRNAEKVIFSSGKTEYSGSELPAKKNKRPLEAMSESKTNHNKDKGVKKIYLDTEDKNVKQDDKNNTSMIGPVLPPGFLPNTNDSASESSTSDEDERGSSPPPSKKQKIIEEKSKENNALKFENHPSNTTVFVSNLHPATKETDLKIIFDQAGEVQKIDLRKQRGGKIFAFVTYSTPEEAQKAFQLEHTPLLNRPLFVSEFKYSKHTDRSSDSSNVSSKYSQEQERNKLFVSNLNKATTQIDLEKLFNQYGDMTSLRLINKKGSSRSFAYVEYATVEAASRYLKAINNTVVRGQVIRVDYSNPGGYQNRQRPFNVDGTNTYSSDDSRSNKEKSDNETFIKPKPAKLGLIPFQARQNSKNQQSSNTQLLTKRVRINFAPSGSSTESKSELASKETNPSVSVNNGEQSSADKVSSARKSNEEFRKMFFKN